MSNTICLVRIKAGGKKNLTLSTSKPIYHFLVIYKASQKATTKNAPKMKVTAIGIHFYEHGEKKS